MPNYQLSKVYQIVCLTTGQKYVGSTTRKTLAERLAGHNAHFKCWKNGKYNFVTSFTILEQGNYQIELLEAYPCNSKDELNSREGHYIRTIDCVNTHIMGRTKNEYYEANKTELAEKAKTYREANKTDILEKRKAYYEATKTEVLANKKAYYEANKTDIAKRKKAYREANKDKLTEQGKKYCEANKTELAEKKKAYYEANKTKKAERGKTDREA
jgi:phage host-nuclease inhibitor protein Gam